MGNPKQHHSSKASHRRPAPDTLRIPIRLTRCQLLAPLLIIGAILLTPERPAWGAEFNLTAKADRISGYAHGIPLGKVLATLADQAGFNVYIDEKLIDVPVTFDLPESLPSEKAIQRMVHPHSYAMIFTKLPNREDLAVAQVKVYAKGDQSASFVKMTRGQNPTTMSGYARGGYVRSDGLTSAGVRSGKTAVREQVKAPVRFHENAMGFTGFDFKDHRRGPDYRVDTLAMASNYREYRREREAYDLRAKEAQLQAAKQNANNRQTAYRAQRQSSIQKTVNREN